MDPFQFILVAGVVVVMLVNIALLASAPAYFERKIREHQVTTSKTYDIHIEDPKLLAEIDIDAVKKQTEKDLFGVAKKAAERFHESLNNTVDQIAANINDLTSTQLSQEFEKYQVSLQALRDQSITEFTKMQKEVEKRRTELFEQLDREVAKEYDKRIEALNGRINDVVSGYLVDILGNQIDLGSQATYIFNALEEHKADIKKDILA